MDQKTSSMTEALILPEFLISNFDEEGKSKKQKGVISNDRPPPMKFSRSNSLCPTLTDVRTEQPPQCTFKNCVFMHDRIKYMASKPPDIGKECFIYSTYGYCSRGLTCRFSKAHTTDNFKNMTIELENATKQSESTRRIERTIIDCLRKRKYDFRESEALLEQTLNKFLVQLPSLNSTSDDIENCDPLLHSSNDDMRTFPRRRIDWNNKLYLAPLTTVGNLPFRRICKKFGADITCGEMAMSLPLLKGSVPEWALLQRHATEDLFGIQLCGCAPAHMAKVAQLVENHIDCDFVDINLGCPIDLVYKRGMGSGMMLRKKPLQLMIRTMSQILRRPLTLKMRTGIYMGKNVAHDLITDIRKWGVEMVTLHGRSREQRYTRLADWDYISKCVDLSFPMPIYGNGDVLNFEDYEAKKASSGVNGIMIARGALIKPWIFTEIKERRHWDISASERLNIVKDFCNYGLDHWGSDIKGVENTRRFLLEWLSFMHRYVPHGILLNPPQKINQMIPKRYMGRQDLETILSSSFCDDWIKITEMFLGKVPDGFTFQPKHRAHAYK